MRVTKPATELKVGDRFAFSEFDEPVQAVAVSFSEEVISVVYRLGGQDHLWQAIAAIAPQVWIEGRSRRAKGGDADEPA